MRSVYTIGFIALTTLISCNGQQNNEKSMKQETNPLLCDTTSGVCEIPGKGVSSEGIPSNVGEKPVKIIYFTDPICSSCWGIEPQLRKLKLVYGEELSFEYRMGGLLPNWSYNSGGISQPSDVPLHWDQASIYYQMPIDGDVWLEDPLNSSYPPSIAFKAAQMQDQGKAIDFLRILREGLFLEKKNITKWPIIQAAAEKSGLDTAQLRLDFEGPAKELFQEDLTLAQQLGVKGFPTIFVTSSKGSEKVYGSKPYANYVNAISAVYQDLHPLEYASDWQSLFEIYPTLASREYAELTGKTIIESELELQDLYDAKKINKISTKNGSLWIYPNQ